MRQASGGALWSEYDLAMLDLDGVVYVGPDAVPGAPQHLRAAAAQGMRLTYVTNNAARPPEAVAEHLVELGVDATARDVVTSAQAAARLLSERLPPASRVFVMGGVGLVRALEERALTPVHAIADDPVAVVSGYSRDLRWGTVIDATLLVGRGLLWVATNTDRSVPTPHGRGPGNGMLVETVARFTGVEPVVAGKPERPLFDETVLRAGGRRPLVVGDRLDTDIEGAVRGDWDSLLVLTGVTGLPELVAAGPHERPTYLSADLAGLGRAHLEVRVDALGTSTQGGWTARLRDGSVVVSGRGAVDDWWRVVALTAWHHLDTTGTPACVGALRAPGNVAADGNGSTTAEGDR